MPTWLAVAIPSVLAVAACLMWALDYSKKVHEIQKLRLELEKLRVEAVMLARDAEFVASGLYKPTPEEVDRLGRLVRDAKAMEALAVRSGAKSRYVSDDIGADGPSFGFLVGAGLTLLFGAYAVIRLIMDLVHLISRLF